MTRRFVSDKGLVVCGECKEPLVAKARPDGTIETWHKDRPCTSPRTNEDEAWERAVSALLQTEYQSPDERARKALKRRNSRAILAAIYAARPFITVTQVTPAVIPPAPTDPYRPRG